MLLSLHPSQLKIFNDPASVKVICSGRGFGKTVLTLSSAISYCLSWKGTINPLAPQTAVLAAPTMKMARSLHWIPLLNVLEDSPLVSDINKTDFRIKWKAKNKPDLVVRGMEGPEKLRGLNLIYASLDEFQDAPPVIIDDIIWPALARNHSYQVLITGTPDGQGSYFHSFCEKANSLKDWVYFNEPTKNNPFFPVKELIKARKVLPPTTYAVEFQASWVTPAGQIYDQFDKSKHVVKPIPQFQHTYIGCDWGSTNPALVVIGLTKDLKYYIIDYWWNKSGVPIPIEDLVNEAARLAGKYNVWKTFGPDDMPSNVTTFKRAGAKLKIKGLFQTEQVSRTKPGLMPGNAIVNNLFYNDRLFISAHLTDLIDDFHSYHRAKDSFTGATIDKEAPNQRQHSCSAARYCLTTIETHDNLAYK
ncbi:hypothetical protein H6F88_31655 [Oculatella sp. FACHB-28]|uniref:hypothetical protein n=1 Tax=Oculatella sp. FACHB-28 TaxID=2692845 RepID=UPI001689A335|nr:hypothetical protein [Oculatella sp. FACHB-28]MBD2060499.1 hypothetical protein [Oculatella sp. FACHB-28]